MRAGVAFGDSGNTLSGMCVDFRDVRNDGLPAIRLTAIRAAGCARKREVRRSGVRLPVVGPPLSAMARMPAVGPSSIRNRQRVHQERFAARKIHRHLQSQRDLIPVREFTTRVSC
jgi:hypothetical protein